MKPGGQIVAAAAARLYLPLIALFAFSLLATRAPGSGVGFVAGLGFGLVFVLHALTFGADAARRAVPPLVMRAMGSLGLIAALAGEAGVAFPYAAQAAEAGVFAATAAAAWLALAVVMARAPTLQDSELR